MTGNYADRMKVIETFSPDNQQLCQYKDGSVTGSMQTVSLSSLHFLDSTKMNISGNRLRACPNRTILF